MKKEYTIILDASHGGTDFGESYHNFHEKDYTLYITQYLQRALASTSLKIVSIRNNDETIEPFQRINQIKKILSENQETIILSIHAHFDNPETMIIYSMYDETNLANEIYEVLKESTLKVASPTTKILPADWQKDYHFIHRELNHHPTVILDCFFDVNDPEDHCGTFAHLIVLALLKHIQEHDNRSSYTVKKGDSLYSIASLNNTTVDEIKSLNNLSSNLLSIGQVLELPDLYESQDYFLYTVKKGDSLYSIARKYDTTVDIIKKLNYLTSDNLSLEQILKIPLISKESSEIVIPQYTEYTVKKGDTLYQIAKEFNTTIDNIMKDNSLTSVNLSLGQVLKIRSQYTTVETYESCYGTFYEEVSKTQEYIVQKGDSLYSISKKFNTTVDNIIVANNLSSSVISVGQVLMIPSNNDSLSNTFTYTVQKGDSLYSIAKKYQTSVNKIIDDNQLTTTLLSIGQELIIERSV